MRIKLLFIFFCIYMSAHSQKLVPDALKVKIAFENLKTDTSSVILQKKYVDVFPSDAGTFLKIFQSENFDQLYLSSNKYLEAFEKCARVFPTEVISKCVDIGKDLEWDADAVGQLQHLSVQLAGRHTKLFAGKFNTLDNKSQQKLITFYADVENNKAFPEFQKLIENLKKIGKNSIAEKLDTARRIRKIESNH